MGFDKKSILRMLKNIYRPAIIMIAAILFFLAASSFNYFTQSDGFVKWLSPDETANYNFTKLYGQTGRLSIYEWYNLYSDGIMYPRSFRSDYGEMKPVSFLGMILVYGKIVSLTSYHVLPYLTPLFAAIGIFYYFLLIRRLFGETNAFISSLILACFPVYLYYSSRSMFHNVFFVVSMIIGLYYMVLAGQKSDGGEQKFYTLDFFTIPASNLIYPLLSGFFLGVAVASRTSELLWLAPIFLMIWIFNIFRAGIIKPIMVFTGAAIAILPIMCWNTYLYGGPFSSGYPQMNQSISKITDAGSGLVKDVITGSEKKSKLETLKDSIFFFGWHPKESVKTAVAYIFYMFPWLSIASFFGLILFLQDWRRWKVKHLVFLICFVILSTILIFYYGSWDFHDNPDATRQTIGNSYTRYWLPIYLCMIPLATLFIMRLTNGLYPAGNSRNRYIKQEGFFVTVWQKIKQSLGHLDKNVFVRSLRILIVFLIFLGSARFTVFGSEEGLAYQAQQQQALKGDFLRVLALTEKNSVIITRYHDKLFFPERKVIVGLFDDTSMIRQYANIAKYLPVYYYNFTFKDSDLQYLALRRLPTYGLTIHLVSRINQDFSLYKIERIKND